MKVSKTKDFSYNTSSKGGARSPYVEAKDMTICGFGADDFLIIVGQFGVLP